MRLIDMWSFRMEEEEKAVTSVMSGKKRSESGQEKGQKARQRDNFAV